MPIQYSNITDEHQAVRTACGVFDVSHMGEVTVRGAEAERYVQHIFTNNVAGAPIGQVFYGMMCYENGGTVDDLLVYKMAEQDFFLVINAANIDKDWAWMLDQAKGFDIDLQNMSEHYGQLAVQGPEAEQVVEEVLGLKCKELKFYTAAPLSSPEGDTNVLKSNEAPSGAVGGAVGRGPWVDLSGLLLPESEEQRHVEDIKNGSIENIQQVLNRFEDINNHYSDYRWAWSYQLILDYYHLTELDEQACERIREDYVRARRAWIVEIRKDAEKEFQMGDVEQEVYDYFLEKLDHEIDYEN